MIARCSAGCNVHDGIAPECRTHRPPPAVWCKQCRHAHEEGEACPNCPTCFECGEFLVDGFCPACAPNVTPLRRPA